MVTQFTQLMVALNTLISSNNSTACPQKHAEAEEGTTTVEMFKLVVI